MSSQTATPPPWPADTEVPVTLGANLLSTDPGKKSLQHVILMYNFKPGHVDYGRDAELLQKPSGEVVIRHPLMVAGKEGKDEDEEEDETEGEEEAMGGGAASTEVEKTGSKAPEMLTFNGHTAKAYDKEYVLIYRPDGTFRLERVTQYFTYLKEARSMSGGLLGSMPIPASAQGRPAAPNDAGRKVAALMRQGAKKQTASKGAEAKKQEKEEKAEAKRKEKEEKAAIQEAKKKEREEKAEAKRREKEEKAEAKEAKRREKEEAAEAKRKTGGAKSAPRKAAGKQQAREDTEDESSLAEAKEEMKQNVTGKRVQRERDEDGGVNVPSEWMNDDEEEMDVDDAAGGGGATNQDDDDEEEIVVKKQKRG